jgi:fatty-acyl-CoA synthase
MTTSGGKPPVVLRDVLLKRADGKPEQLAFAFGDAQWTYAELADRATARAAALRRIGVDRGSHVAIVMSSGLPFMEVFWAVQLLGAVPCVFNPLVPTTTLARRIERIRPMRVLTDDLPRVPLATRPPGGLPEVDPDDLAFLQLTSGTAGEPRAAMVTHQNVMAFLRTTTHLTDSDVPVSWMPPWHDFGLVGFILASVHAGAGCYMLPPTLSSIPEWLQTISGVSGTVTGGPDFAYRLAARLVRPSTVDLRSLRAAFNGGEAVRVSSIEAFENRFSTPGVICPAYGLAEATVGISMHRPGEPRRVDSRGNVSCGRPICDLDVRAGHDVNHPDEIWARGAPVFQGYLDEPDDTASVLQDGWLRTGDNGYIDDDGHLFVLGRRSTMIKRAGTLIPPRELEEAAEQCAAVKLSAAMSLVAPERQDEIVVVVEATDAVAADEVRAEVANRIATAVGFTPHRIHVVAPRSIPRTENGKIRHGALAGAICGAGHVERRMRLH